MSYKLSISLKAVKKLMVDLALPQTTIEAVVLHQFRAVEQALKYNKSVEISGFGKFIILESTMRRQMDKHERALPILEKLANESEGKTKEHLLSKLEKTKGFIEALKTRLNEN